MRSKEMLTSHRGFLLAILLAAIAAVFYSTAAYSQEEEKLILITQLQSDQFPKLSLNFLVLEADGRTAKDVTDLKLLEDGVEVNDFKLEVEDVGGEIVFVIDANETISTTDQAGGLSRLEKVRDSIIRFSNFYMDPLQKDRVSIIVPAAPGSQLLDRAGMAFANEVINAVNFYHPELLGDTPLQRMMEQALNLVDTDPADRRSRSVVLFTDGAGISEQLDYSSLTEQAHQAGAVVYGVILGNRADAEEIDNLSQLTDPTGGVISHMSQAEAADEVYGLIDDRSTQHRLLYQSMAANTGSHELEVIFDSATARTSFELTILPPTVDVPIDNSKPIRRVARSLDAPLELMEPLIQPLVAQVGWPDGYPRRLESASLLVNGTEVAIETPIFASDGILTFDWDIRNVDQGLYELQIQVVDELGLHGISAAIPLAVEIERPPEPLPTFTSVPAPTSVPQTPILIEPEAVSEDLVLLGAGLFFLALFGLLVVLFSIFVTRRRGSRKAVAAAGGERFSGSKMADYDPYVTYVVGPEISPEEINSPYLEALEHAPEHPVFITIVGSNIALGRDPQVVQIPFNDRSVSRLHARIVESQGSYRIYDEGSSSGTYVNYERIGLAPRILNDNDHIHFGRVHLKFHLPESADSSRATAA